jgi:hypothetical protein
VPAPDDAVHETRISDIARDCFRAEPLDLVKPRSMTSNRCDFRTAR